MGLKINKYSLYALLFLAVSNSYSQDTPVSSQGNIQFYVDHSSFSGKNNKTYVEFYLMIFSDQLISDPGDTLKQFTVNSIITEPVSKKNIAESSWTTNASFTRDSLGLNNMVVYDQWAELLKPGAYEAGVKIELKNPDKSGETRFSINVPSFSADSLSVSQIEFVSDVQLGNDHSPFVKGNERIIPNPWRRYGALNSRLTFFYEIYNISSTGDLIKADYSIQDGTGKIIKELKGIGVNPSSNNIGIVHGINVSGLRTGVYKLYIKISDISNDQFAVRIQPFEVIQIDSLSNASELSEEEAEIEGALIGYLSTPGEFKFFSSLNLRGKTKYILNYWAEKDPTPGTAENEFLEKIQKRFNYAKEKFGWGKIQGWKTDRGRIIIKYGMPDEIEYHSAESDSKNYEIWTYNQDRSYIFVFADLRSNGNYTLVNSTKEGEISDPNWIEYIK